MFFRVPRNPLMRVGCSSLDLHRRLVLPLFLLLQPRVQVGKRDQESSTFAAARARPLRPIDERTPKTRWVGGLPVREPQPDCRPVGGKPDEGTPLLMCACSMAPSRRNPRAELLSSPIPSLPLAPHS